MLAWVSIDHKLKIQVLKYYLELKNCVDIVMIIIYESVLEWFVITVVGFTCSTWGMFESVHTCFYWTLSYFWLFHLNSSVFLGAAQNLNKKINIEYKLASNYAYTWSVFWSHFLRNLNFNSILCLQRPCFKSIVQLWVQDSFSFAGNKSLLTSSIICSKRCL